MKWLDKLMGRIRKRNTVVASTSGIGTANMPVHVAIRGTGVPPPPPPPPDNVSSSTLCMMRLGGEIGAALTNVHKYATIIGGTNHVNLLSTVKSRTGLSDYNPAAKVLLWNDVFVLSNNTEVPTTLNNITSVNRADAVAKEHYNGVPTDQPNPVDGSVSPIVAGPSGSDPWVLRDASGNFVPYAGYPNEFWSVPHNKNYQAYALTKLIAKLKTLDATYDYDGVQCDNIFPSYYTTYPTTRAAYKDSLGNSVPAALFTSDANYNLALLNLLDGTLKKLRDGTSGDPVLPPLYISSNSQQPDEKGPTYTQTIAWYNKLKLRHSCVMCEYVMQHAGGAVGVVGEMVYNGLGGITKDYDNRLGMHDAANTAGVDTLLGAHFDILSRNGSQIGSWTNQQKIDNLAWMAMYLRCAFLLNWNGTSRGGSLIHTTFLFELWDDKWTAEIGIPTTPKQQVSTDCWQRPYTQGVVCVNPRAYGSASATFALAGSYIHADTGAVVSSLTLPPVTAMLLRKAP